MNKVLCVINGHDLDMSRVRIESIPASNTPDSQREWILVSICTVCDAYVMEQLSNRPKEDIIPLFTNLLKQVQKELQVREYGPDRS